jgi:hypothetical protein
MSAVKVNGAKWRRFETEKEWLRIIKPDQARYEIVASY